MSSRDRSPGGGVNYRRHALDPPSGIHQLRQHRDDVGLILLLAGGLLVPLAASILARLFFGSASSLGPLTPVLAVAGWGAGVALLWLSTAWTTRQKLLGTLVFPGGLALPVALSLLTTSTTTCVEVLSGPPPDCSTEGFSFPLAVGIPLLILLVAGPITSTLYLAKVASRR